MKLFKTDWLSRSRRNEKAVTKKPAESPITDAEFEVEIRKNEWLYENAVELFEKWKQDFSDNPVEVNDPRLEREDEFLQFLSQEKRSEYAKFKKQLRRDSEPIIGGKECSCCNGVHKR